MKMDGFVNGLIPEDFWKQRPHSINEELTMDNLSPNLAPETNETLRSVETPVACISSAAMANDPPTSTMVERRPP